MAEAKSLSKNAPSRTRFAIIALIFLITTVNYADRATFSMAGSAASKELSLSPVDTGYILSAFAWAYAAAQIPSGALLDRFGTRVVYISAILLWSLFTMLQGLTGFITGLSALTMLFTLRFLVGLSESPSFPGNARIVLAWFPAQERGMASAIFNSAQYFSIVAFAPLMGWLVHSFGWRSVFWIMGVLGVAAAVSFAAFIRDPADHKRVNAAELDLIRAGGGIVAMDGQSKAVRDPTFTWSNVKQLLANRMMLGIYVAQYCINALTYFFVTWFPIYLVKDRGLNILEAGFVAAVPALCGFVGGLVGGVISDRILARGGTITRARKTPILVGMLLASLIMVCAFLDSQWAVIVFISIAFFGKGVASLGWAVMSDVAPRRLAGLAGGVFNTFGNVAGIVTPIAVGYLVKTSGSFDSALIFLGVHCIVAILAYFLIVQDIKRLELAS